MINGSSLLEKIRPGLISVGEKPGLSMMFELGWQCENAAHTECYFQQGFNVAKNNFPPGLADALENITTGDVVRIEYPPSQLLPHYDNAGHIDIDVSDFKARSYKNSLILPATGRFYPRKFIPDVKVLHPQDPAPIRITACGDLLGIDSNHPLASRPLSLVSTVVEFDQFPHSKSKGPSKDVVQRVTANGPGMQARWKNQPTDFWCGEPFVRDDTSPDAAFYSQPRLVHHIDHQASSIIGELYRQLIPDQATVLDLMASWVSHLPDTKELARLVGLGMNADELELNKRMDETIVQDLNENMQLPFAKDSFDAVICTVSVEYLVRPFEVVAEVARVLKPGGRFIVTFSNRWFPPKVIRAWELLHEHEHMGLVLEYFLLSGLFTDLGTWSMRGLPRPANDKYSDRLSVSDPVYAVYGAKTD